MLKRINLQLFAHKKESGVQETGATAMLKGSELKGTEARRLLPAVLLYAREVQGFIPVIMLA